jgi:hypothetical protein
MATILQFEANQKNARRSTGPKTGSGKAVSARNALRHGLASGMLIAPWECREDYDALLAELFEEYRPATPTETILVHQMAQHHWLAQRAIVLQQQALQGGQDLTDIAKKLDLLVRYQTSNERAFHKSRATLANLKNDGTNHQIGFVSQKVVALKATQPPPAAGPLSAGTETPLKFAAACQAAPAGGPADHGL